VIACVLGAWMYDADVGGLVRVKKIERELLLFSLCREREKME
jgi:hypothetical protein